MRFLLSLAVAHIIQDKLYAQPKELREPCERLIIKISELSRVPTTSTPIGPVPEVELRTCSSH